MENENLHVIQEEEAQNNFHYDGAQATKPGVVTVSFSVEIQSNCMTEEILFF